MHKRQKIREYVVGILTGLPTTQNRVYSSRISAIDENTPNALLIYTQSEESSPLTLGGGNATLMRYLSLTVEIFTRSMIDFDDKIDQICTEVEGVMGGDTHLGGNVLDCQLMGSKVQYYEADTSIATMLLLYRIGYNTYANDPTQ